jgi:probable blue pigment (indigoidine) exporter
MVSLTPLYAICFVAIRIGLSYAPPLAFAALRVLLAGVALESMSTVGLVGALLALASAIAFGASTIVVARLVPIAPLLSLTAWQFLLAGLPLAGLSLVTERQITQFWNPTFLIIVAVLALFGTALTTSVWYWLVQRDNAGRLSLNLFLVPVLGVGLAVLTLGEPIGWREGSGIILTLSGVLLALRADTHEDQNIAGKPASSDYNSQTYE